MDEDEPATIVLRTAIGLFAALLFVAAWALVEHLTEH